MSETNKMNCPNCGTKMNHHADKPLVEAENTILEIYTCAKCGKTEAHRTTF